MSNELILSQTTLPARLQQRALAEANPFAQLSSTGFPVISIKGKVFHVVVGDDRKLVTKPSAPDEPAASLEVVIVDFNRNRSKVYYATGYVEGNTEKPDCYSNDGESPAADAEQPQSKKCMTCPHNQWGSRITENNKKAKACGDSVRLVVAPIGELDNVMLLRVPATSVPLFGSYGSDLFKHSVMPCDVVTKIGFDYSAAYPSLTFSSLRFLTDEEAAKVEAVSKEAMVTAILGADIVAGEPTTSQTPKVPAEETTAEKPKPKAKPKAKPKVVEEPVEEEEVEEEEVEEEEVEEEEAAPTTSNTVVLDDADDIEDALANLDFDD